MAVQVKHFDDKWVTLLWPDGKDTRHFSAWLRASCYCVECKNPVTFQKVAFPYLIRFHDPLVSVKVNGTNIDCEWLSSEGQRHSGYVKLDEIETALDLLAGYAEREPPTWPGSPLEKFNYKAVTERKEARWQFLAKLAEHGIAIITDSPTDQELTDVLPKFLAHYQLTIDGKDFELNVQEAITNVAHTTIGLPLHEDMPYYESVPGFQLMQCITFDDCIEGGESRFCDSLLVAKELKETYPDDYQALLDVPATFQKRNKVYKPETYSSVNIVTQRPHIVENHLGQVISIRWSSGQEGPLIANEEDTVRYYRGYERFSQILGDKKHHCVYRMTPGDIVVFNNRRVFHSRDAFVANGGMRHFKGCYAKSEEVKSELKCLSEELGKENPHYRVLNHCHL